MIRNFGLHSRFFLSVSHQWRKIVHELLHVGASLSDGIEIMGTGGAIFSAVIFVVGVFLLVYARRMADAGVLR